MKKFYPELIGIAIIAGVLIFHTLFYFYEQ